MKKLKSHSLLLIFFANLSLYGQVWAPEGVYIGLPPHLIYADNQLHILSKLGEKNNSSFWQISTLEENRWIKRPILELNKNADIKDFKRFKNEFYVAGNFTFDNENYNALVKLTNLQWQGVSTFKKENLTLGYINKLEIKGIELFIGGQFAWIGNKEIPNLSRYDGIEFELFFKNCKNCSPNSVVLDITSNDTTVVICGLFNQVNQRKSKYLYRIKNNLQEDTFANTPKIIEKIELFGQMLIGVGQNIKSKTIYNITTSFIDINYNIDSLFQVNSIHFYDGNLTINGLANHSGKFRVLSSLKLENNRWEDFTNNNHNPYQHVIYRGSLFSLSVPIKPLSIWNPNKYINRFHKNMTLVKAKVFNDINNNCVKDDGEEPITKQFIKLPFINRAVFTNQDGMAEFLVPNNNTLRFVIRPSKHLLRSNCADTSVTKTFIPGNYIDSIQFPLKRLTNINDIRVTINSSKGNQVVRDKRLTYYVNYENLGTNTLSGKITLKKNPNLSDENIFPNYSNKINDSTYEWVFTNLAAGERKTIVYNALPSNSIFENNFQFQAAAAATITSGTSMFEEDDFDSIPQTVNSDFNGFRKDVYPSPSINDSITYLDIHERDLRYNISFNNFSTDTVFYAIIIDTLDLNLDMSYIQETGSNKIYYTEIQTDPNNQYKGILIWHFPNIKLAPNPTKNYENENSGSYIGFKVVTKALSNGYLLKNVASVFYDNEYAGSTNAVYCTVSTLNQKNIIYNQPSINVFPNPSFGNFNIDFPFEKGNQVLIYNYKGQLVYNETINLNETQIKTHLKSGLYILKIITQHETYSVKLVVD
ncbi:MAG: T9SS type A sorting domain-containing protein [Bacteroidota bacterium]|nr:T9SS type A sorting domain-containing protein [Bacteroidota bacterium]